MDYGNYLYTQSPNDRRGILWTKYVLMWALKQMDQTENTDARLITLDSGAKISVGNMFIFDQQTINPNFDNFLKTTAAYHAILTAPDTTLANNKYARNFYEYVKNNYGRMPTELKNFYDMLFSLSKKKRSGINKTLLLGTNISPYEYSEYSLIKAPTINNRFAFYIPCKVTNINIIGLNNQKTNAYQNHFNSYLKNLIVLLDNQLLASVNKQIVLDTFYNTNVAPTNLNNRIWNNSRKYEDTWDHSAKNNKCFGFGIKDPQVCKELMLAITKSPTYDSLRVFMITYSQPAYNHVWSTSDEMVDLASRGRINLSIARRLLRYLGFKFAIYLEPVRQAVNAYTNWINIDGNKHFNDPLFTATVTRSAKVASFLRVLSEYVAYTYSLRIPENVEEIVNLGSTLPKTNYTNNSEKTWDYAERYRDYLDEYKDNNNNNYMTNPYDFMAMFLLNNPELLNKINNLYVYGVGIPKTNEVGIDEYMRHMELPKNRINTIRVFAGGSNEDCAKKTHIHHFEKMYYKMINELKERGLFLDQTDNKNLRNQIYNLKIYWKQLNKATKKLSDSKAEINDEYYILKKAWKDAYVKYKKQELKVLISLTLLLRKIEGN